MQQHELDTNEKQNQLNSLNIPRVISTFMQECEIMLYLYILYIIWMNSAEILRPRYISTKFDCDPRRIAPGRAVMGMSLQMDRWTDRQMDSVIPVYPLSNLLSGGTIKLTEYQSVGFPSVPSVLPIRQQKDRWSSLLFHVMSWWNIPCRTYETKSRCDRLEYAKSNLNLHAKMWNYVIFIYYQIDIKILDMINIICISWLQNLLY